MLKSNKVLGGSQVRNIRTEQADDSAELHEKMIDLEKENAAIILQLQNYASDLNDQGLSGGEADSFTLGVNWYATPAIKFSANYINVLDIKGGPVETVQPNIVQVRSQWAF
jgi:phosphate-selective porin